MTGLKKKKNLSWLQLHKCENLLGTEETKRKNKKQEKVANKNNNKLPVYRKKCVCLPEMFVGRLMIRN